MKNSPSSPRRKDRKPKSTSCNEDAFRTAESKNYITGGIIASITGSETGTQFMILQDHFKTALHAE